MTAECCMSHRNPRQDRDNGDKAFTNIHERDGRSFQKIWENELSTLNDICWKNSEGEGSH